MGASLCSAFYLGTSSKVEQVSVLSRVRLGHKCQTIVRQTLAPTTSGLDYFGYHEKVGHEIRDNLEKLVHFIKPFLRFFSSILRNRTLVRLGQYSQSIENIAPVPNSPSLDLVGDFGQIRSVQLVNRNAFHKRLWLDQVSLDKQYIY